MRKQLWMFGLLSALALVLTVSPSEANFVQCPNIGGPCGVAQGATDESDLINGSQEIDAPLEGLGGDDVIFANGQRDFVLADTGNDIVFGGLDSDELHGEAGNDIILPGPDTADFRQFAGGGEGNDSFIVFAGETAGCLDIQGLAGNDVVNLIGFGPYSATKPFGIPDLEIGAILVTDPIAGGRVIILVSPDDLGSETINGLPTPNPTFLTIAELDNLVGLAGTDPCPEPAFA